ncbi:ADP-ribosylglycohydrolase family protein [Bacillus sp. FJAT-27245]|uniref:ADP-ribosylglycohydrolase family protein n=1 Tax=Bacillus sp. FJAT-27245 TaxID=1684144 RepID=UPI0006A767D8|nr:ADP-ribosylglycohydrolase family protein [Bacillus sp. FJAT-27245]
MKDQVLGTLYGMAIGDAMGMPSELWSRRKVKEYFGKIEKFLDGPESNIVACNFTKGQFTDDTTQALLILDALIENQFIPDDERIANAIIQWAERIQAFDNNILGPSSKAALTAIKNGEDQSDITALAETNGAAMRIAPIGCLFSPNQMDALIDYVWKVSKVTHASDVAIAGASMIAGAVSAAMNGNSWDEIMSYSMSVFDKAIQYGGETYSASLKARLEVGLSFAEKYKDDEEAFSNHIYHVIGCGVLTSESVPAALSIAYYAKSVERCALLCANIGGDTDTIGAMATAICGAKQGFSKIDESMIQQIDSENPVNLHGYAEQIVSYRDTLNGIFSR